MQIGKWHGTDSATHPFEWYASCRLHLYRSPAADKSNTLPALLHETRLRSEINLSFPEEVDAQYVLQTLEVDEELQPEKIHRTLTVKGAELHVYLADQTGLC
ncbi:hypothetical protein F442_11114 [Phytophthora nicotianae P10297]|uniref:Uncharacterized protein n=1 Tax=Phytophthora nicotianae P10297 TaxID=1317064 RepID=W2Z4C4_PHYNI|nr:hypothetical protein F442_11114 [Phytophthora nicotianae P10297]